MVGITVRSLLLLVTFAVSSQSTPLASNQQWSDHRPHGKQCVPLGGHYSPPRYPGGHWIRDVFARDTVEAEEAPELLKRDSTSRLDAFYKPPADFECKAPGTILRSRRIASAFFTKEAVPVTAYQLLYRTTAVNGSAIATVTTIFAPETAKRDRFISFHTAYDSSAPKCGPSYNYIANGTNNNGIIQEETFEIEIYLQKGYIVASPDYEGPEAAFTAGRLAGMAVLDGIRAVSNFKTLKFTSKPKVVGIGYSGGAIATGWAAQLQQPYAPELDMKGWSAGGTPANLTGCLVYDDMTVNSGFLPVSIVGLSAPSAYGCYLNPVIDDIATKEGFELLHEAETECVGTLLTDFANKSILSTEFQKLGRGLLTQKTVVKVLADTLMGQSKKETPVVPVFLYHGAQDDTIPYRNASTLATEWCKNGATVNFTTFSTGGHVSVAVQGISYVQDFVDRAFAGTVKQKGCTTGTV